METNRNPFSEIATAIAFEKFKDKSEILLLKDDLITLRQAINQKGRENVRDALLPEQLQAFDKAMGE